VLRSKFQLEVDLVDLENRKCCDCSLYQNFVIGGGVRAGKVYDKALNALKTNLKVNECVFCFSWRSRRPKTYESAKAKFAENTLTRYPNINPGRLECFWWTHENLGKSVFNNVDLSKAEAWAEELGKNSPNVKFYEGKCASLPNLLR
jgi:hypothetical protein